MGGNSWLDVVKKALIRSPTKHTKSLKARMREEEDDDDELPADKKSSKRRWIFKKTTLHETTTIRHDESTTSSTSQSQSQSQSKSQSQPQPQSQSHTSATKPIMSSAEVMRLSISLQNHINMNINGAALVIQTSFRRYLARRALEALKGVVKLQALVRGHIVRRRTNMTLMINCIQTLLRVQHRLHDHHNHRTKKLSNQGRSFQLDQQQQQQQQQRLLLNPHPPSSPLHPYDHHNFHPQSPPITPSSLSRVKSPAFTPRYSTQKEERIIRSLSSSPRTLSRSGSPSYMSATVSAMARIRSTQITTTQRRSSTATGEVEKKKSGAKKRLSFSGGSVGDSDSELDCNLRRSPIYTMERRRLSTSGF